MSPPSDHETQTSTPDAGADAPDPSTPDPTVTAQRRRSASNDASALEGRRLGRYVLRARLGEGAMGAVYEAEDATLGRTVALKVLHRELSERDRQRIQREALALARLSHPNVVHVYEIGREDERTFVAMELVRGRTLDRWQRERPPWRECVRVYLQAGEGLAAAHAVGLVHRDFKPSNCILGDDGRVRVLDFGLARSAEDEEGEAIEDDEGGANDPLLEELPPLSRLTQTGVVVGTVAYMPLEQLMGAPASVASDQFSFCVSLYEALYGGRPFAGEGLGALVIALRQGRIEPAPRRSRVPARLRRALLRGLAAAPAERWPSMDALLAELSRVAAPRRRGATVLVGLGGALGLAAGATLFLRTEVEPCATPEAALEGTWGPSDRAAVEAAFAAEEVAASLPRVTAALDRYAAAWVEMYAESCRATFVARQQSEQLFDRRMRCLERRRNRLRSTIDALVGAETPQALIERSILPFKLPALEPCADVEALAAEHPLPDDAEVHARLAAEREQLDRAETLREAGDYAAGLELATAVVAAARELGHPPLLAEALTLCGRLQNDTGSSQNAGATLREAILLAADVGDARIEAVAWTELLLSDALTGQTAVGLAHELAAQAAVERADDEVIRGWLLNNLGVLHGQRGYMRLASEHLRRALEVKQQVLGPDHVDVGISWYNLGMALANAGMQGQARETLGQARRIFEATVGAHHPMTHHAMVTQCWTELLAGRSHAAVELCQELLQRYEHTPPSPTLHAVARFNLALAQWDVGADAEALEMARSARALASDDSALLKEIDDWLADPGGTLADLRARLGTPRPDPD